MHLVLNYILAMLGYIIVFLPFYYLARKIYLKRKGMKTNKRYELILGFFVLYCIGLASQTIIPRWEIGTISSNGKFYFHLFVGTDFSRINYIPFRTISTQWFDLVSNLPTSTSFAQISFINLIGNILLFSPIGFFTSLLWNQWRSWKRILLLGFLITFSIEFIQVFIGRSSDIDDILLNTFGVVIGYAFYQLLIRFNLLPSA